MKSIFTLYIYFKFITTILEVSSVNNATVDENIKIDESVALKLDDDIDVEILF